MRAIPERLRDASCGDAIQIDYLYLFTFRGRPGLKFDLLLSAPKTPFRGSPHILDLAKPLNRNVPDSGVTK